VSVFTEELFERTFNGGFTPIAKHPSFLAEAIGEGVRCRSAPNAERLSVAAKKRLVIDKHCVVVRLGLWQLPTARPEQRQRYEDDNKTNEKQNRRFDCIPGKDGHESNRLQ
jgi:hypothetical protein